MEEEKKNGIIDEPPREEELTTADPLEPEKGEEKEPPQEETGGPQSDWNYQIPYAVAEIVWPEEPAQRARYINTTAPILNLIEFHTCLGPMGQLPPTARLLIGCAAIIGGVVVIKVGQARKEKDAQKEAVLREASETAENDQFSGSKEGKESGRRPQEQGPEESKVGGSWRRP